MNQLKQANTNSRGHRLFLVVSVGRKWTQGIWFEHPLTVSRVQNKVVVTWKDLDGNAIPTLKRMARAMYKRQSKMPKSLRKALFNKI